MKCKKNEKQRQKILERIKKQQEKNLEKLSKQVKAFENQISALEEIRTMKGKLNEQQQIELDRAKNIYNELKRKLINDLNKTL